MHLPARTPPPTFFYFAFFLLLPLLLASLALAQLSTSFYATSCPQAVSTIANTYATLSKKDNVIAPSTVRLILHDCFVEGCDGSILLSSSSGNKAERDAPDNTNLPQNAFDAVIAAKKAVEQICPGVVSCADVLALGARNSIVFLGGPAFDVPLGRLDGRVSTAASVEGALPGPNFNVQQLAANFAANGLTLDDMVVLSGAHTIGFSHCDQFKNRLYNFNSTVKLDPSMNPGFSQILQNKCPASGPDNFVAFDILSPFGFDNGYYNDLVAGKGLLSSDQVLFQDPTTRPTVQALAASQSVFFSKFTAAMVKMSSIGVKQGAQGEVRTDCTKINSGGGQVTPAAPAASPPPAPAVSSATPPKATLPAPVISAPPPFVTKPPAPVITASPPPSTPAPTLPSPQLPVSAPPPVVKVQPPSLPPPFGLPISPPPFVASSPPPPFGLPISPPPFFVASSPPPPEDTPPDSEAPPPPEGGFTIPGIPGVISPIHVPLPPVFRRRFPPPPGADSSSSSSSSKGKT